MSFPGETTVEVRRYYDKENNLLLELEVGINEVFQYGRDIPCLMVEKVIAKFTGKEVDTLRNTVEYKRCVGL